MKMKLIINQKKTDVYILVGRKGRETVRQPKPPPISPTSDDEEMSQERRKSARRWNRSYPRSFSTMFMVSGRTFIDFNVLKVGLEIHTVCLDNCTFCSSGLYIKGDTWYALRSRALRTLWIRLLKRHSGRILNALLNKLFSQKILEWLVVKFVNIGDITARFIRHISHGRVAQLNLN